MYIAHRISLVVVGCCDVFHCSRYNRFSCCHGADDARARMRGYFKRELARVSVRARSYRPMRIKNFGSIWGLYIPPPECHCQ